MLRVTATLLFMLVFVSTLVRSEGAVMKTLDYEACRALVLDGKILSMQELMELVRTLSDGKIIETQLLQRNDSYIYEMEIAGVDGMVKMLYVDARSGELVQPVVAKSE